MIVEHFEFYTVNIENIQDKTTNKATSKPNFTPLFQPGLANFNQAISIINLNPNLITLITFRAIKNKTKTKYINKKKRNIKFRFL